MKRFIVSVLIPILIGIIGIASSASAQDDTLERKVGVLKFENAPMSEVIKQIGKNAGIEIEVVGTLPAMPVSVSIDEDEPLRVIDLLRIWRKATGLTYQVEGNKLTIFVGEPTATEQPAPPEPPAKPRAYNDDGTIGNFEAFNTMAAEAARATKQPGAPLPSPATTSAGPYNSDGTIGNFSAFSAMGQGTPGTSTAGAGVGVSFWGDRFVYADWYDRCVASQDKHRTCRIGWLSLKGDRKAIWTKLVKWFTGVEDWESKVAVYTQGPVDFDAPDTDLDDIPLIHRAPALTMLGTDKAVPLRIGKYRVYVLLKESNLLLYEEKKEILSQWDTSGFGKKIKPSELELNKDQFKFAPIQSKLARLIREGSTGNGVPAEKVLGASKDPDPKK